MPDKLLGLSAGVRAAGLGGALADRLEGLLSVGGAASSESCCVMTSASPSQAEPARSPRVHLERTLPRKRGRHYAMQACGDAMGALSRPLWWRVDWRVHSRLLPAAAALGAPPRIPWLRMSEAPCASMSCLLSSRRWHSLPPLRCERRPPKQTVSSSVRLMATMMTTAMHQISRL